MNEQKTKTLEELLEMSRKEQNAYLSKLPQQEAEQVAHAIFRVGANRDVKKMIESLTSKTKNSSTPQ